MATTTQVTPEHTLVPLSKFSHITQRSFSALSFLPNTGYGNIYLSDAEGLRFSLSLRNNKRDAQGRWRENDLERGVAMSSVCHIARPTDTQLSRCDFEKVQGIEGIYITNEQRNADADSRAKPQLRTKITFDKGGKWQLLKPPAATNKGKVTWP